MNKCLGIIGHLLGHKFSGRYSEGNPNFDRVSGGNAREAAEFVRAIKPVTYHCDVCERCGAIVRKDGTQ